MSDRFQLETEITNLHTVADDLNLVAAALLGGNLPDEEAANAIIGLSAVLRLRADAAFEAFKGTFKLDGHGGDDDAEDQF